MGGFRLTTLRGVDIRINWSVLLVGWLVAWSLATSVLPGAHESGSDWSYWVAGILTTVGFFLSLIAHEMGHAILAQRNSVGVKSITLWLLGGVALLETKPETPRAAFRIAVAGPAVSFAIGVAALVLRLTIGAFSDVAASAVGWLAMMNLIIAAFNLAPAFPLDGGRIYQAWAWARSGDEATATRAAARLGTVIGSGMLFAGFMSVMFADVVGGLWFMAIGWFLRDVARAELQHLSLAGPLQSFVASDVMTSSPNTVSASATITDFVDLFHETGRHATYPVLDKQGELIGLASISDLADVKSSRWAQTPVSEHMTDVGTLLTVDRTASLEEVTTSMQGRGAMRALVLDEGRLVGIISPSDVARLVGALEITMRIADETRTG